MIKKMMVVFAILSMQSMGAMMSPIVTEDELNAMAMDGLKSMAINDIKYGMEFLGKTFMVYSAFDQTNKEIALFSLFNVGLLKKIYVSATTNQNNPLIKTNRLGLRIKNGS